MAAAKDSVLHELDIEGDGHFIADKNAAGFQHGVPGQAEVFAVDLRGRRKSQARIAPGVPGGRGRVGPSTVNTTLRVTSRMVKSPPTSNSPSLLRVIRVDLNVSLGNFSTWKKSSLLRCASRWESRVLM